MTKIYLIFIVFTFSLFSNQTETFSQKFENYLELRFQNFPGNSFYDSEGNLNISDLRDTTFFQNAEGTIPSEISSLYDRDYFDLSLSYQYYFLENLNVNGSLAFRNDRFTKREMWERFDDSTRQVQEFERIFDDKKQSLLMPINLNLEYFLTRGNIISSAIVGTSIPLGDFDPFVDSTLNGNGIGNFNFGFTAGYAGKTSYLEISTRYLSNFSSVADQLNIAAGVDLFNVKNVDLFGRISYLMNLEEIPPQSFNPALPNANFNRLMLNAGASIKYYDFRFKLNYLLTLQAANQYDYRSIGLSVAYRFKNEGDK